jgi:hypothetical protein
MPDHDIPRLLAQIEALRGHLKELSDDADLRQLEAYIRKPPPGWTTVAEFTLVSGLVQGLSAHSTAMREVKRTLVQGGLAVSLDPQPLPLKA